MVKRIMNIWNSLIILCYIAKRWRRHYSSTWVNAGLIPKARQMCVNTHRKKKKFTLACNQAKKNGRGGKKTQTGMSLCFSLSPHPLAFDDCHAKLSLCFGWKTRLTVHYWQEHISTITRLSIRSNRTKESTNNKKVRSVSLRKTYWTITEFMYLDHIGGTISARDIPPTVTQCNFRFVSTNTRSC